MGEVERRQGREWEQRREGKLPSGYLKAIAELIAMTQYGNGEA